LRLKLKTQRFRLAFNRILLSEPNLELLREAADWKQGRVYFAITSSPGVEKGNKKNFS
jgi:hypothetical protein